MWLVIVLLFAMVFALAEFLPGWLYPEPLPEQRMVAMDDNARRFLSSDIVPRLLLDKADLGRLVELLNRHVQESSLHDKVRFVWWKDTNPLPGFHRERMHLVPGFGPPVDGSKAMTWEVENIPLDVLLKYLSILSSRNVARRGNTFYFMEPIGTFEPLHEKTYHWPANSGTMPGAAVIEQLLADHGVIFYDGTGVVVTSADTFKIRNTDEALDGVESAIGVYHVPPSLFERCKDWTAGVWHSVVHFFHP